MTESSLTTRPLNDYKLAFLEMLETLYSILYPLVMTVTPLSKLQSPTISQLLADLIYSMITDIKDIILLVFFKVLYKLMLVIGLFLIMIGRGLSNWTGPIKTPVDPRSSSLPTDLAKVKHNNNKEPSNPIIFKDSVSQNGNNPPLPPQVNTAKVPSGGGLAPPPRPLGSEYHNSVRIHRVGSSAYFNIPLSYLLDKGLYYMKLAQTQNNNSHYREAYHYQEQRQQQIAKQIAENQKNHNGSAVCRASWQALKTIMTVIYPDQAVAIANDAFALYHENALPTSWGSDYQQDDYDSSEQPRMLIIQRFFRFFLSSGMDLAVDFAKSWFSQSSTKVAHKLR